MRNIKKSLLFYLSVILLFPGSPASTQPQTNCEGGYNFYVSLSFTIPSANCQDSKCILDIYQSNAKTKLINDYGILCTDSAAQICIKRSCPQPVNCQVVTNSAPSVFSEICSTDTNGKHWCTIKVVGSYNCICAVNVIDIYASNTSGNYCPGDYLTLTAVPDLPIPNINYIQWFLNDTIIDNANTMTHTVASTGKYEVLIVDTDGLVYLSPAFNVQCAGNIPTMQEWGLIILAALLLIIGTIYIIRKRGTMAFRKIQ